MTEEAVPGANALSSKNRSHTRSRTTETFKQIQASFQQEDKAREDEITRRRASMRAEIRQARGSADTRRSPTLSGFTMARDEQMSPKKDFEELIAKARGGRSVKAMASQWTGKSLIETNEMAQRRLLETEKAYRRGVSRMSADLTSLLAEGHDQLFRHLKGAPTPETKQMFMCAWAKDRRAKGKQVMLEDGMALLRQLGVTATDTKGTPLIKKHSSLGSTPSSPSVSIITPKIPATDICDSNTTDVLSPATTVSFSPWKRSESEWKRSESEEGKGANGEWGEWMAALLKAMDVANDRLGTGESDGEGSGTFLQKRESWEARERKAAKAVGSPYEASGRAHSLVRNSSTDSEGGGRWSGNGQVTEAETGHMREARQWPEHQEGLSTTESQGSEDSVPHESEGPSSQQQQTWSPPSGQHDAPVGLPSATTTQGMQEQASAKREQQAEQHNTHVHAAPPTQPHEASTEQQQQPSYEAGAASAAELEFGDGTVHESELPPITNATEEQTSQLSEPTSAANIDQHTHHVTYVEGERSTPNVTADVPLAHIHPRVDNGIPEDVLAEVGKHGYWFSHTWRPLIPVNGTAHTQTSVEVGSV